MEIKSKAVSGVKWTSFSTVVCAVLQLIQLYELAKLLKPRDFGLMAIIMIVSILVRTFSDLGVSAAIIHHQDTSDKQISTLFWLNIFVGFLLFASVFFLSPLIASIYSEPALKDLLIVLSVSLVISPIGSIFTTLMQKDLKFGILANVEIVSIFLGVSVTIFLAYSGFEVWSLIYGQLTGLISRTILYFILGIRTYSIKLYFHLKDVKSFLNFGLFQVGEKFVNFFSERVDQFLIGYLLGTTTLGYYSFAFNIVSQPVSLINPVFNKVAFPVFSKLQEDKTFLRNAFIKVLQIILFINAPLLLGLALTAPSFVRIFFGEKWIESIILIQILSFLSLMRGIGNPVGSLILAKGRADIGFYWNIVLFIISVPLIILGAKLGGVIGVSVSLIILQLILFFPNYMLLVKPFIGDCLNLYMGVLMKPLALAFTMAYIVYLIKFYFLHNDEMISLLLQITFGICIYIFLLYFFNRNYFFEVKNYILASKIKI